MAHRFSIACIRYRRHTCSQEGVDEIAINDAFLLEMLVYRVLKRHFWTEPYYMDP